MSPSFRNDSQREVHLRQLTQMEENPNNPTTPSTAAVMSPETVPTSSPNDLAAPVTDDTDNEVSDEDKDEAHTCTADPSAQPFFSQQPNTDNCPPVDGTNQVRNDEEEVSGGDDVEESDEGSDQESNHGNSHYVNDLTNVVGVDTDTHIDTAARKDAERKHQTAGLRELMASALVDRQEEEPLKEAKPHNTVEGPLLYAGEQPLATQTVDETVEASSSTDAMQNDMENAAEAIRADVNNPPKANKVIQERIEPEPQSFEECDEDEIFQQEAHAAFQNPLHCPKQIQFLSGSGFACHVVFETDPAMQQGLDCKTLNEINEENLTSEVSGKQSSAS
ncbi:hypothetical protein BU23DRAFT_638695 [Bimuria novae-zelandiae CBS 107.79]|uniref:Uncharacterized protein n=1 Tax=Bimuria novae-zelandiae CBS 107.79 TaxID=1447943 RepID=A0A6A5VB47_9PLEO|nr:hypothetical protein BU23DRAFT_638695 [Bimuria novae-zelandiae CBS 107.79]